MAASAESRLTGVLYISAWIVLSSVVIVFNKWILDRFPFPITLTTWHMFFATIATQILARTTTLVDRSTEMTAGLYLRSILPIGMCYSMSLVLSNVVYLYLSMSFIQMLKASGPVATLLACWSLGIRNPKPSMRVLLTVCIIVLGVAISSLGEVRFVLTGFVIQGCAVVFEAYKNALQQSLLGGKVNMSSMTLMCYFAPVCMALNSSCICFFEWDALQARKPSGTGPWVFLANGCATFALNVASVTVIKKTSSVVLTLSGIPKSILLSVIDMAVYHSPLTLVQAFGFSIAGVGTYHYSTLVNSSKSRASIPEMVEDRVDLGRKSDEESRLWEKSSEEEIKGKG